jgi:ferredoxin-fold anticodon binding domain-containing protein
MEQTLDNVAGEAVDSEIAVEAIRLLVEIVDILLVEIVDILGAAHRRRQLRRRS